MFIYGSDINMTNESKNDKINWQICNFREHIEEKYCLSKKTKISNYCMLKNNVFIGNKQCDKENCILFKIFFKGD